jgi:transcriptional regulator with XRE-family HTH domain
MARVFERQWFLQRLGERQLTQAQFAAAIRVDPASVSLLFNGKRVLQLDEAQRIADVLRLPLPVVLLHAGVPMDTEHKRVKITGHVNGAGLVSSVAPGSEDEVDGPRDLPTDAYALQARTHNSPLAPLDRWIIFVSGVRVEPLTVVDGFALCGLADGKQVVAHVRKGYKEGTVNLHVGDHVTESVKAIWAMRVLWLRPNGN